MDQVNTIVAWVFIGSILGLGLSVLLKNPLRPTGLVITIISALLLGTLRVNWVALDTIETLRPLMNTSKIGSTCPVWPSHPNAIFNTVSQLFKDEFETKCTQVPKDRITFNGEEVKSVWRRLLEVGERNFLATNTIAPSAWPIDSCQAQRNSKIKIISRVMIKSANALLAEDNGVDDLARRQLKECGVRKISYISKQTFIINFNRELSQIGANDLVLVDDTVLLATQYDEGTQTILGGFLTVERHQIDAARRIFSGLDQLAVPYATTNN